MITNSYRNYFQELEVGNLIADNIQVNSGLMIEIAPTGVHDEVPINNAFNSLTVNGGNIYLGAGTFSIEASIMPQANVNLIGNRGTILLVKTPIGIDFRSISIGRCIYRNFKMLSNTTGSYTGMCFGDNNSQRNGRFHIDMIHFENFNIGIDGYGDGLSTITTGFYDCSIDRCEWTSCYTAIIICGSGVTLYKPVFALCNNSGSGIAIQYKKSPAAAFGIASEIYGGEFIANDIDIKCGDGTASSTDTIEKIIFNSCWFEQEVTNILLQSDSSTGSIGEIFFSECLFQPNATVTTFFGIDSTFTGTLIFENCQMWTSPNSSAAFLNNPTMGTTGSYKLTNCYLTTGSAKTQVQNQNINIPNIGGSASAVSYAIAANNNGVWGFSGDIGLSPAGNDIFRAGSSRIFTSVPVWHGDGSVGVPTITFTNNQNSGIYNTAGTINISSLGTNVFSFSTSSIQSQLALNMNSHQINNVTDPSLAQDGATKNYVDNQCRGAAFTPTFTVGTNVASVTNIKAYYTSCNGVTNVYFKCLVTPSTASTLIFYINYPITNISGACVGSGISNTSTNIKWTIDNNNDTNATVQTTLDSTISSTGAQNVYCNFMYQ